MQSNAGVSGWLIAQAQHLHPRTNRSQSLIARLVDKVYRLDYDSVMPTTKDWARKFSACVKCNKTTRPHVGKGLCHTCYFRKYVKENSIQVKNSKHLWYLKAGGALRSKILRESLWFDSKREAVLKRDKYRCRTCGSKTQLCVHHKDENGRGSSSPNNKMGNLVTVCRRCHMKIHRKKIAAGQKKYFTSLKQQSKSTT